MHLLESESSAAIKWFKNNKMIKMNVSSHYIRQNENNHTQEIRKLTIKLQRLNCR